MSADTATAEIPQPEFPYLAYGVHLSFMGDEGGMIAPGRVDPIRFVAACNQLSRKELGLLNVFDDRSTALEDVLVFVRSQWAVSVPVTNPEYEWQISWYLDDGKRVTEDTPGAMQFTVLDPE